MRADGSVIIDTKILDDGMEKGFEAMKNEMSSVGLVAEQVGEKIRISFSEWMFQRRFLVQSKN